MNATRNKKHGMCLAAVTGLLVMLTAAPAVAQHEGGRHRQTHGQYACGIDGCTDRHLRPGVCFAKREYDRGHSLGYREGKNQGYRDALRCNPFCDGITRCLDRYSKFFARGYVDAYPLAYETAFGQYQSPPRRPRWKPRNGRGQWGRGGSGNGGWGNGGWGNGGWGNRGWGRGGNGWRR